MPTAHDGASTGGKAEAGHQEPKKKLACEECYRKKVKCSQEKPMCLKCRENGTYCTYLPSMRRGKGKAVPRPARQDNQVQPHLTGDLGHFDMDPSYLFEGVTDPFWPQTSGFPSPYEPGQQVDMDMTGYSLPPGSTSGSSSMSCSPLPGQHMTPSGLDSSAAAPFYTSYQPMGRDRSNSCDTSTTMSRTTSLQATRDVQQTHDLHLTPMSTPPSMEKSFPNKSHQTQTIPHAVVAHMAASVPGGPPFGAQQLPPAVSGSQGSGTCECFNGCQQCLNALRKTDLSKASRTLKLCGMAMQACLCLLTCRLCRDSVSADTVSLVASIIDKVAGLYSHIFSRLDEDLARSEAHQGGINFAQLSERERAQQIMTQRLATLRNIHHSFIEMCNSLPEAHAIALAWVNRINSQIAWIEGMSFDTTHGFQGGNLAGSNVPDFGPNFI